MVVSPGGALPDSIRPPAPSEGQSWDLVRRHIAPDSLFGPKCFRKAVGGDTAKWAGGASAACCCSETVVVQQTCTLVTPRV